MNFSYILFIVLLIANSAIASPIVNPIEKKLKSASELSYPPFAVISSDNQADGFSVELLRAVTQTMNIPISFHIDEWNKIKKELQEGTLDVLPLVGRTMERDKFFDFTTPYITMHSTVFVRKNTPPIASLSDLANKKLLVMSGDNAHEFLLRTQLTKKIITTKTYEEAFIKLSRGHYDAIVVQKLVGIQLIKNLHLTNLKAAPFIIKDLQQDFCFAVKEGDKKLLALLNEGLAIVKANGVYEQLYNKWFAFLNEDTFYAQKVVHLLIVISIVFLSLIGTFFVWQRILQRIISDKTQALSKSEQLLHNVIVGANLGFWDWNYQTGEYKVSERWLKILGFSSAKLKKYITDWSKRIHGDDYKRVKKIVKHAIEKDIPFQVELRMQHYDGSWVWIESSGSVVERHKETGEPIRLCGTHQDITKRINSEQNQKKQYEQQQILLENINGISWELDPIKGHFTYVSPNAERILGYSVDAWVDMDSWVSMVVPEDQTAALEHCQLETLAGRDHNFEYRMRKKNGDIIWVLDIVTVITNSVGKPIKLAGFILDNSEQKKAELEIRKSEKELKLAASVFTHAREGIMITDIKGTILEVNHAFTKITGYSHAEILGKNPRVLKSGEQNPEFYKNMWHKLIAKGYWEGEIWNKNKQGNIFAEQLTISSVRSIDNKTQHYVALFTDISKQKYQQQQLENIAHFDALTNLPNRLLLTDRLNQALLQAQRRNSIIAVAFLDLDDFKAINDNYGHSIGDQLLTYLADRMHHVLREGDTIARFGGDEFVIVLTDLINTKASIPLLTRLLEAATKTINIDQLALHVSASIGVTFYPQTDEVEADQLLRQADQAMYQAKIKGKNSYHIFDEDADRHVRGHHEDVKLIEHALKNNEFILYYQPKVNMRTGDIIGVEALIRWQHPKQGLLTPNYFLPLIENHAISLELGDWVINKALSDMETWYDAGFETEVSINISALQLQQSNFSDHLFASLRHHTKIKAQNIILEVLETSALEDILHVSQVIQACHKKGLRFALDDFGTGYSSLTYLKRLPVSQLKVDQTFVFDMLDDPENLAILEGILGLGNAFHHQIIAEGVETIEHGEMLLHLGIEIAQGYAIAHPLPSNDLQHWIKSWQPDPLWTNSRTVDRGDIPLLFASTEHRAWIKAIEEWLNGERTTPPTMNQLKCRFGLWLHNEGQRRYGENPVLHTIEQLHEKVHETAIQLSRYKAKGDISHALEKLSELKMTRDKLIKCLKQLLR